jgi:hypothetical protein
MKKILIAPAAAALGIGFLFAVPTVVVDAAPSCTGGSAQANAICVGCALGGSFGGQSCAGGGLPAASPPAAPAPLAPNSLPPLAPEPPVNPGPGQIPVAPAPPPGTSPGHGEPSWCGGPIPAGTDSQCPITGLTPGINH